MKQMGELHEWMREVSDSDEEVSKQMDKSINEIHGSIM